MQVYFSPISDNQISEKRQKTSESEAGHRDARQSYRGGFWDSLARCALHFHATTSPSRRRRLQFGGLRPENEFACCAVGEREVTASVHAAVFPHCYYNSLSTVIAQDGDRNC
jgi:hypothetical protein